MSIRAFVLCCTSASLLALPTGVGAGVIPFTTAKAGAYGELKAVASGEVVGSFIWNVVDGGDTAIGVWVFGPWPGADPVVALHLDFTGAFFQPRSITSAEFVNENAHGNPGDDSVWLSAFTGLQATFTATGPGDSVATGEWFDAEIRFNGPTPSSQFFSGYFVTEETRQPPTVPEPGTVVLSAAVALIALARNHRRRRNRG